MKLLLLLTTAACLEASASGYGQTISLSFKNATLEKVFAAIEKQSQYHFIYTKEEIENSKLVSIDIKEATLTAALDICLKEQPLSYTLQEPYIIIKQKEESRTASDEIKSNTIISGKIVNEKGEGVAGATVAIKGSTIATASNDNGEFVLEYAGNYTTLVVSSIGYTTKEVLINGRNIINVALQIAVNNLDETIVIAYGNTTRRLNTGNVSKVSAEEISRQPVSNPLAALQGRVPGLIITQTSGMNGAAFKVQLRGQNSLLQGSEPLFIIDGVPFAPGNSSINQLTNATTSVGGLSPFNLINPSDIESIEVLKDADATAIYGSRGANGVILITTKKGKAGKTKVSASVYNGGSKVTRSMKMLNTQQYLQMRREAFANDGIIPNATNAPDLILWDTTRYTDFRKMLIGGTAHTTDVQLSISGGNTGTQFIIGGGYRHETTVFPTELGDNRASLHFNLNHHSPDKKLGVSITANYAFNKNNLTVNDLARYINYAPTLKLFDESGKLNWQEGGVSYRSLGISSPNPFAFAYQKYSGGHHNLVSNIQLSYKILTGFMAKLNMGYNMVFGNEVSSSPSTAIDPNANQLPSGYFANQTQRSWIIEPQAEYITSFKKSKLNILAGSTLQENTSNGMIANATNYASDILLGSLAGAGNIVTTNSYSQYRYKAFFGRITYNWDDRYIANLSGRRDGSSRFGPARQYSNFGAAAMAWIFSSESFVKNIFPFLSFGKLRGSYGITGNDQIGDYKYIDTWTASPNTYQGVTTLDPSSLFNGDYSWEINRKMELELDLGFLNNRILFSIAYFKNRCSNQLVNYSLPIQTGFSSINKNLDALIQNKGVELQLNTKNITGKIFNWHSAINITFSRNRLLAFPFLSTSSYANTYIIGATVSTRKKYEYLGVDPSTGIYTFKDVDSNGTFNAIDRVRLINTDPAFYGGIQNNITYRKFELSVFLEFKKQTGQNYLGVLGGTVPGFRYNNQPLIVLNRWQKPGDITAIQKFTATTGQAYINSSNYMLNSNGSYSDASYLRCKNLSLSYTCSLFKLKNVPPENCRLYLQAQNLFTITNYIGGDPETQSLYLSPLKTLVAGIQFNF